MGNGALLPQPKKHWWHSLIASVASSAIGSRLSAKVLPSLDRVIYQRSNGRTTLSSILAGVPVILVKTTGAKSGQPRTVPLLGIPDGGNIILIASNWGGKKHPAWYYNLKANPKATVTLKGQTAVYTANEVTGEEREQCWARATVVYPGYNAYKKRTDGRVIPVLLLTPQQ